MNTSFTLHNFGPIKAADVEFGDMTFIVGPQASGKSIFLQAWKLREDYLNIKNNLNNYSYNTDGDNILKHYFGIAHKNITHFKTMVFGKMITFAA